MSHDEQQLTILSSLFCHLDVEAMRAVGMYEGETLRRVVHAFQDALHTPQGKALMMLPTWEPALADAIVFGMPEEEAVTVRLLLHLKKIEDENEH